MIRTSGTKSLGPVLSSRVYFTSTIGNSKDCEFIQSQKDELLVVMTKYFAKQIDKETLSNSLNTIKTDVGKKCPTYVPKADCC
jgi:hypothetical protein